MGCECGKFSADFVAISIPPALNLETVLDYLDYLGTQSIADYECGKIAQQIAE